MSIKAAYYQTKKEAPPTGQKGHSIETLIGMLSDADLKRELEDNLPDPTIRQRFRDNINDLTQTTTGQKMLQTFFAINPTFDTEEWMLLHAMFYSVDIKYGADPKQGVLQIGQLVIPRLNEMELRMIGCVRKRFPYKESHRRTVAEFVDKLPKRYHIMEQV